MMPLSHYWRNVLIVVPIVGTTIATVFFILRLSCRYFVAHKLRIEDLLMGMGLLCTYGVAICEVYSAILGIGIGETIWVLPPEKRLRITLANWILIKFWPSAQVFVKLSIVLFLRRLLGCNQRFRRATIAVMVFSVAWGLTAIIGNTFQCWPIQYAWIKHIQGHCMSGQNTFYLIIGSVSMVEDVVILCLPLPIVWGLHMPVRDKVELSLLFSIGCLVCIFSILRVVALKHYQTDNLTIHSSLTLIWTVLELDMAIICGCLPLMKPIFHVCMGAVRKSVTRLRYGFRPGDASEMVLPKSSPRSSRASVPGVEAVLRADHRSPMRPMQETQGSIEWS